MNWEIIGGICAIIGVFFLIYQYALLPINEISDNKKVLIALFDTSRNLIDGLISDLDQYSLNCDAEKTMYNANFSIKGYRNYLIDLRDRDLNENLRETLMKGQLTKELITEMKSSLHRQIHSFNQSQSYLDSKFKYK